MSRFVPDVAPSASTAAAVAPSDAAAGGLPFVARGVEKRFGSGPPVLRGIDLDVAPGQVVALLGLSADDLKTVNDEIGGAGAMVPATDGLYKPVYDLVDTLKLNINQIG